MLCHCIDHVWSGDLSYCLGVLATAPKQFCNKDGQSKLPVIHLICPSLFPTEYSQDLFMPPSQKKARCVYLIAAKPRPLVVSTAVGKAMEIWSEGNGDMERRQRLFLLSISLGSLIILSEYIATVNSSSSITLLL